MEAQAILVRGNRLLIPARRVGLLIGIIEALCDRESREAMHGPELEFIPPTSGCIGELRPATFPLARIDPVLRERCGFTDTMLRAFGDAWGPIRVTRTTRTERPLKGGYHALRDFIIANTDAFLAADIVLDVERLEFLLTARMPEGDDDALARAFRRLVACVASGAITEAELRDPPPP